MSEIGAFLLLVFVCGWLVIAGQAICDWICRD
jgi:hypothetical protein